MYTRHEEVRQLLDETIAHFKKLGKQNCREYQIFVEVLGEMHMPGRHEVFLGFLHDVSTCPPAVIWWCQEQINAQRLRAVE